MTDPTPEQVAALTGDSRAHRCPYCAKEECGCLTDEQIEKDLAICSAASRGPWFMAYNKVFSDAISKAYDKAERAIPEDAPDTDPRYAKLPDPVLFWGPVIGGDIPTRDWAINGEFCVRARESYAKSLTTLKQAREENKKLKLQLSETARQALSLDGQASELIIEIQKLREDEDSSRAIRLLKSDIVLLAIDLADAIDTRCTGDVIERIHGEILESVYWLQAERKIHLASKDKRLSR